MIMWIIIFSSFYSHVDSVSTLSDNDKETKRPSTSSSIESCMDSNNVNLFPSKDHLFDNTLSDTGNDSFKKNNLLVKTVKLGHNPKSYGSTFISTQEKRAICCFAPYFDSVDNDWEDWDDYEDCEDDGNNRSNLTDEHNPSLHSFKKMTHVIMFLHSWRISYSDCLHTLSFYIWSTRLIVWHVQKLCWGKIPQLEHR